MTRVEREKERRKLEIIEAAERLFADKGFENVKMEDVARVSEFSRKTLYAYFKNKEDLYMLVYLKISKVRWNLLSTALQTEDIGIDKLRSYGNAYLQYALNYSEYFRMGMYMDHNGLDFDKLGAKISSEYRVYRLKAFNELKQAYETGFADGSIRPLLDVEMNIKHLIFSMRTMLNEILLGYEKREFFIEYLNFFLAAVQR
jgi:AcrR family transcriptional regulator